MNPFQLLKSLIAGKPKTEVASGVLHIAEIPYEEGNIRYRYSFLPNPDDSQHIRHGLFVHYQQDGTVLSEGNYVNGVEAGLWTDYHPNGQKAAQGDYLNGKEHGVWRFWSPEGVEESPATYVHGKESA